MALIVVKENQTVRGVKMSHEQFMKVQSFFETMPKVKHKITVKNPKTEVVSDLTLEGLQDFF